MKDFFLLFESQDKYDIKLIKWLEKDAISRQRMHALRF